MTPNKDDVREAVAEALWQAESVQAADRRRRVPWEEAIPREAEKWRALTDAAFSALAAMGLVVVPVEPSETPSHKALAWQAGWAAGREAAARQAVVEAGRWRGLAAKSDVHAAQAALANNGNGAAAAARVIRALPVPPPPSRDGDAG